MKSHRLADLAQSRSSFFRALEALSPGLTILVELLLRLLEPRLGAARILQRLLLGLSGHRLSLLADRHSRRGSSYPPSVSESPEQIRRHIAVLEEFEQRFGEWVTGLHNEQMDGEPPAWSNKERARRDRELRELAVSVERAMLASGVGMIALGWPPFMRRSGVMVGDLLGLMFYEGSLANESPDGLDAQRMVLNRIPSQLAGLRLALSDAEATPAPPESPKAEATAPGRKRGRWPTVIGRIRHVPPVIGFIADVGGFVVVVLFLGRVVGVW